jgi:hypothetical protein
VNFVVHVISCPRHVEGRNKPSAYRPPFLTKRTYNVTTKEKTYGGDWGT